jgi:hypothetical protein
VFALGLGHIAPAEPERERAHRRVEQEGAAAAETVDQRQVSETTKLKNQLAIVPTAAALLRTSSG